MKVALVFELDGSIRVVADEPVDAYVIDEHTPDDRVYQLKDSLEVEDGAVDNLIGEDAIWLSASRMLM